MCRHPAPDTAGHPPPQLLLLPAIFSLQTKTARAVAKTTFRERMKMKHSIMRMEAAPVRDPAANAGAGTLYMVVEEVSVWRWWRRLHAGHRGYYRHCHVTRPSLGRLLGCGTKDKKYPAQPPRYSGDARPGADAGLLATGRLETKPLSILCYT